MSMSDQMVNGDGLKRLNVHRPKPIKKKLKVTKFTVKCPECDLTFLLNNKIVFFWDSIISVECPNCKHEEMY
jgi:hypothetical protein